MPRATQQIQVSHIQASGFRSPDSQGDAFLDLEKAQQELLWGGEDSDTDLLGIAPHWALQDLAGGGRITLASCLPPAQCTQGHLKS